MSIKHKLDKLQRFIKLKYWLTAVQKNASKQRNDT